MTQSTLNADDAPDVAKLLALVASLRGRACTKCGRPICGHEIVFSVALGCQASPRCLTCLALGMQQTPHDFRDQLFAHVQRRACYHTAWQMQSRFEFGTLDDSPPCLWPPAPDGGAESERNAGCSNGVAMDSHERGTRESRAATVTSATSAGSGDQPEELIADARWDAGEMGCGDLVLELRGRLRAMSPGSLLELVARDPGAPSDLPAWCGLTGHVLVRHEHPHYWIRRKEN